jgi:hypothetical protein
MAAITVARKGRTPSLQRLRILSQTATVSSHDSLDEASYVKTRQTCCMRVSQAESGSGSLGGERKQTL